MPTPFERALDLIGHFAEMCLVFAGIGSFAYLMFIAVGG